MKKRSVMRWTLGLIAVLSLPTLAAIPSQPKVNQFAEGERIVYTRLVEAYRINNLEGVVKQRQILERNYPLSVHLDNAYYLNGMAELQHGRLGEALKTFDIVKDHFVKSNKRPAALFAIGATYQRLNLPVLAHRMFQHVMTEYPGSPESQRAWMQLRVEQATVGKVKR